MTVELIAEFTTNHLGHLGLLLRMVRAAKAAGADWIKMQAKDVETFYTQEKLDRPYASPFGTTYRDYRTAFELSDDEWSTFDEYCNLNGIPWFCTIQDLPSLHYMLGWELPRYKVASSNARNIPFLKEVAANVPRECEVVLSVGGSTLPEIESALSVFGNHRRVWLLHCVAEYPCPTEHLRLGNIAELRRRFRSDRVRIGYSGHEVGLVPSVVAAGIGAEMIERHFCISRHTFTHHIECSLEPDEFKMLRERLREIENGKPARYQGWPLTSDAYECSFGMTDTEKRFLVDQTYGTDYMGEKAWVQ